MSLFESDIEYGLERIKYTSTDQVKREIQQDGDQAEMIINKAMIQSQKEIK